MYGGGAACVKEDFKPKHHSAMNQIKIVMKAALVKTDKLTCATASVPIEQGVE